VTRWLFVRHGESVANREGWLAGWLDAPLTATGRARAEQFGEVLRARTFARVFTSDASRAIETARLLVPGAAIEVVPAIRERNLGAWEGAARAKLRADGRFSRLMTWDGRPPGGESHRDIAARMLGWLATVPDGGDTLVVGHGGTLRATLGWLDGLPTDEIAKWSLHNLEPVERHADRATWEGRLAALAAAPAPGRDEPRPYENDPP